MAVPKRKTTKSRSGKRRSHINFLQRILLKIKSLVNIELSHHIDLKTGTYKGRQVLDPKE